MEVVMGGIVFFKRSFNFGVCGCDFWRESVRRCNWLRRSFIG